jgi:hypothetical protein
MSRSLGCLHEDVGEIADLGQRLLDAVQYEEVGGCLHLVDDVVELLGECVDVFAVERCHEARVEPAQDGAGHLVAVQLAIVDQVDQLLDVSRRRFGARLVGVVVEEITEAAGALGDVRSGLVEQRVEPVVARHEPKPHSSSSSRTARRGRRSSPRVGTVICRGRRRPNGTV